MEQPWRAIAEANLRELNRMKEDGYDFRYVSASYGTPRESLIWLIEAGSKQKHIILPALAAVDPNWVMRHDPHFCWGVIDCDFATEVALIMLIEYLRSFKDCAIRYTEQLLYQRRRSQAAIQVFRRTFIWAACLKMVGYVYCKELAEVLHEYYPNLTPKFRVDLMMLGGAESEVIKWYDENCGILVVPESMCEKLEEVWGSVHTWMILHCSPRREAFASLLRAIEHGGDWRDNNHGPFLHGCDKVAGHLVTIDHIYSIVECSCCGVTRYVDSDYPLEPYTTWIHVRGTIYRNRDACASADDYMCSAIFV